MPILKIPVEKLYISSKIQDLCLRKGKSFPNGCPNYGKKLGCPPQPLLDKIFDLAKPSYLIYTEFNVRNFAEKMQSKHPNWTEKQCYNPRYWQQTAREQHTLELDRFLEQYPNTTTNRCPEGHGLNVHVLMFNLGIKLEWPPRNLTRIVSLGGYTR
jgi:hypothetical protein